MKRSTPEIVHRYGNPSANPTFWNQLDPYSFLADISGPVQLHHGTVDEQVPIDLSRHLAQELHDVSKSVELFEYPEANHNFSGSAFNLAVQRSVDFFNKNL